MRVLITGVTGRIGANVARRLAQSGHAVRGFVVPGDSQAGKLPPFGLELVEGTLASRTDVQAAVDGQEAILHLAAAFQAGGPFTPEQYFDLNVKGTFHILEAAQRLGAQLRHLIFASTDATMDKYPPDGLPDPITETSLPPVATDWYGYTKVLGEHLVNRYVRAEGLRATVVRFCMVWGAGEVLDWPQFRLAYFLDRFRKRADAAGRATHARLAALDDGRERLVIACDAHGRPWKKHCVEVRDLVDGLERALGNPATFGKLYQMAGPLPFTWDEAVPLIAHALRLPFSRVDLAGIAPTHYAFDLTAARRDFGYAPRVDIRAMVEEAVRYKTSQSDALIPTRI
ncbi:MAG: NAD(P)-dependent oxidoreductase [Actinobacteria bacterium]|nr:NAD(P)-dependent oxidoreductase [Actinomycetota bacterium]